MSPISRRNHAGEGLARLSKSRLTLHPVRSRATRLAAVVIVAMAFAIPAVAAHAAQRAADAPQSTPLERVQALVQPTVVYEQIEWTAWVYDGTNKGYFTDQPFKAVFQCTGFVVNPTGYIGTAGHCVDFDSAARGNIINQVIDWAYNDGYYASKPPKETIATFAKNWRIDGKGKQGTPDLSVKVGYGVSVSGEPTGKALSARVVASRGLKEGDPALLKIDAENLTVAPLSDNKDTRVGTQIVSVGYPVSVDLVTDQTFSPSFKEGSISAEKTTEGGLFQVYEISAAVSGGMSGGPTTSLSGDVVGVNSFGIVGETQQFNFVQAAKTLSELMRGEGVDNSPGKVTDLYRAGVAAYFAGDRDAAIAAFQQTIAIVPNHEFAQNYLRKAQELPQPTKILGLPVWLAVVVVGFVVIVVVIAVVLFLLLRGRRKKLPVAAPATPSLLPPLPPPTGATQDQPAPTEPIATTAGADLSQPAVAPEPETTGASERVAETAPAAVVEPVVGHDPEPGQTKLFCPNCGEQHVADAHFCEHCGHALSH